MKIEINKENNAVKFVIKDNCNLLEIESVRRKSIYYNDNNQLLGLICDGNDFFRCNFVPQTMHEIEFENIDYMISNSNNITKIKTVEKINDELNENVIAINYDSKEYQVLKYVHNLEHSTKIADGYFSNIDQNNLTFQEAKEIILTTIKKIKQIPEYDRYIELNKLIEFLKEQDIVEYQNKY